MLNVFYKKNGKTYSYYMKDWEWQSAKKALAEYQRLHGKDNCDIIVTDDFPMGEAQFWATNWLKL